MALENDHGCAAMQDIADDMAAAIDRMQRRLTQLRTTIKDLEARPTPDLKKIQSLKQVVESLEKTVEVDGNSLSDLQTEISKIC